jgi:hypothetical protein
MASSQTSHARRELDLPLARLDFLHTISPPALEPLLASLREKHSGAAPDQTLSLTAAESPSEDSVRHLVLLNELADLTNEDPILTKGLASKIGGMAGMNEVARTFSHGQMTRFLEDQGTTERQPKIQKASIRSDGADVSSPTTAPASVIDLQRKLFHRHTSAVVARMVNDKEITIENLSSTRPRPSTNTTTKAVVGSDTPPQHDLVGEVVGFLDGNLDFDIRHQSLVVHLHEKGQTLQAPVAKALKVLQTTQALTHTPEALPALSRAGMTSALVVAQMPKKTFVARLGANMGGDDIASAIHSHATTVASRNVMALTSILQVARGSGVAMIDGKSTRSQLISQAKDAAAMEKERVNLENLFGTMDVCECDDCNSVTSPAAYFVELLQYLRNNNLDPKSPFMGQGGIHGIPDVQPQTPLGVLLARRPDIANLQLTCANTKTVLPYIDLANEVMESFIVHLDEYAKRTETPKQAIIDVYDADPDATEGLGGSSAELLAKPQNTNDKAYCALASAVYPSTKLPFNQPVASIRLFLDFLGTSRADLGESFIGKYTPPTTTIIDPPLSKSRKPEKDTKREENRAANGHDDCSSDSDSCTDDECSDLEDEGSCPPTPGESAKGAPISKDNQNCLAKLHNLALQRANDAERLLLTQEEYIILTKEAFWPRKHFEIRHGHTFTAEEYKARIGIKNDWEYWGVDYADLSQMLSQDENNPRGLTFVKDQFLPRTGITYSELVDLLRTDSINPNMLKGRNRVIMEAFRLSYTYMKSLVKPGKGRERFLPLVEFIDSPQWHKKLQNFGEKDVMTFFDDNEHPCGEKERCWHHHPHPCSCRRRKRILKWLCVHFERMGKIIVLESLIAPFQLPWEAKLVMKKPRQEPRLQSEASQANAVIGSSDIVIGLVRTDRTIIEWNSVTTENPTGVQSGRINLDGTVVAIEKAPNTGVLEEKPWSTVHGEALEGSQGKRETRVMSLTDVQLGKIDAESIFKVYGEEGEAIPWMGLGDDCDISKDRLRHLDGGSLTAEEYDKIHRFLRLWRKLGWTMVELDAALRVLGIPKPQPPICDPPREPESPKLPKPAPSVEETDIDWIDFSRSCSDGKCGQEDCGCGSHKEPTKPSDCEFTPPNPCGCHHHGCHHHCHQKPVKPPNQPEPVISSEFLHELVALKKLADLTGLEILNLLAFWGTITTAGSPSLYSRLFLTHNLKGIDTVFLADKDQNYLTATPPEKLKDHVPILLAAFQLRIKDFNDIVGDETIVAGGLSAELTLENVSKLYRYVLLGRILSVQPARIATVFETLGFNGDPHGAFLSAESTLKLLELWNSMADSGFTFAQLRYLFNEKEITPLNPVGPTEGSILRTTMAIYTGLNDIDAQHSDISSGADGEAEALAKATSAVVLQNAQLIFDPDFSTQIGSFLDGRLVFSTTAPSGLVIAIPKEDVGLIAKLKYAEGAPAHVQITGQLTDDERQRALALSANPGWANAIKRCANQAKTLLRSLFLSGVFPPAQEEEAKRQLLTGDLPASSDGTVTSVGTAPGKRLYFLTWFIPFLRRKLADKLVTDTISSAASLDPLVAGAFLKDIITDPSDPTKKKHALEALQKIKTDLAEPTNGFTGYLVPPATDTYILVAEADNRPAPLQLEGQAIEFRNNNPDDEPSNLWATDSVTLAGGKLYKIILTGVPGTQFSWKTERSLRTPVPSSSLLANHVTDALRKIFAVVYKCAMLVNGFALTLDEVVYVWKHGTDFGTVNEGFNWNAVTLPTWERLRDYTKLRNSLPKLDYRLIDLFTWASDPTADAVKLVENIQRATLWEAIDVKALISPNNFNILQPSDFKNEFNLTKIQKALEVSTKIGMPIDSLFQWAKPQINFWKLRDVANGIRTAIRALYKLSDWEVAIKPTYDKLRQMQSDALTAYLINQPALKDQGVFDADSLFEFLLIDTQMCPCMETSRLKQATSTVQLFIQRCFLDLEQGRYNITASMLDRDRWKWMEKYRVWEANRKVFLYPENWIQPSLRDDKSPIYLQLESEMMQRDLTSTAVLDAMKNFLFRLDEVANLEVDAIYFEDEVTPVESTRGGDEAPEPPKRVAVKIHFFARTRGAPYKFYYRTYEFQPRIWSAWQDMAVDVPRYEVEKEKKIVGFEGPVMPKPTLSRSGGCYLVPFTFNSRLLVAIPQFAKVQLPAPVPERTAADIANNSSAEESTPDEYWEIKMGLSELRNGKWTAKFITSDSISEQMPYPKPLPPLGQYQFVVRDTQHRVRDSPSVTIDCFRLVPGLDAETNPVMNPIADVTAVRVGMFNFTGSHFAVDTSRPSNSPSLRRWSDFQFQLSDDGLSRVMRPIQSGRESDDLIYSSEVVISYPKDETDRTSTIKYPEKKDTERFYHPFVGTMLERLGSTDSLDSLFQYLALPRATETTWQAKQHLPETFKADAYGASQLEVKAYNELARPYALYNWELGFHAPIAIADRLLQNQQFDLALKMMHYVFDPLADQGGPVKERVWKWLPFRETDPAQNIRTILAALRPNTSDAAGGQINQWRDRPFEPHVVARLRPTAYMKFVVMKYISILIAYGDYYFRQNTLETIPMAIQLYVLASHIYGPSGQKIPKRGKKRIQTYNSLLNKWDAFSNAMIQMEILFPFSINQIASEVGKANGVEGLANIFGFASTGYFCVPDNPELRLLRTTIDDRLFKIRHCQDINGIERKLPLYEPPIDPGLLVAATAAGLSLSSVLNDLNAPLPNFRFKYLLRVALEMCEHLRRLGKAFVLAKEKKDYEALLELKQRHENVIHQKVMEQKKLARDEAQKATDSLVQSRKAPEYRMKHTLKLLGEDIGSIPSISDVESEFKEVVDIIEAPVVESGLKLVAAEKEQLEKMLKSVDMKPIMNAMETLASELHVLPTLNAHASPFGVGLASCWGLPNIAKGIQGAVKAYNAVSEWLAHQSSNIHTVQSLVKQKQVRTKEANTAGHEIKHIDQQIVTQKIRVATHEADIIAQEQAIEHSQEVHDFLTTKYTSAELYTWAEQQLSNLYYQTYTSTYDVAKKAEMAFRYERGISDSGSPPPFIRFGYWEPRNDGLLSGERLYCSLKELETAYQETRGHDFEITKHVSLRSINPLALFALRGSAKAEFAVPEVLFDMDFPGHYARRVKTVALTIRLRSSADSDNQPDYYTQVNCTLRLTANKFRTSPFVRGRSDYPEKADADDPRFTAVSHVPISAIATSAAARDPGLFEVKFDGERFLPFEGAGAISAWRLEFHDAFRSFDYAAVEDVVLHLSYTARDGGRTLGDAASAAVVEYIRSVKEASQLDSGGGLFAVFDIARDFAAEFDKAKNSTPGTPRTVTLGGLNARLPVYTKGTAADRLRTQDVYIVTDLALAPGDVSIRQGGTIMAFSKADGAIGRGVHAMSALHSTDGPISVKDWVVTVGEGIVGVKEMLILVRYTMS